MATPTNVTYTASSPIYGGISSAWWATIPPAVAFGDSISVGHPYYNSPQEGGPSGNQTLTPLYQMVQLYPVGFDYDQSYQMGVGGSFVSQARYAVVAAAHPVAAFLHSGINDIIAGHTWLTDIKPALDTIVAALNAVGTHLFVDEVLPSGSSNASAVATYNANYATWCAANGATLVPVFAAMVDPGDNNVMLPLYDTGDHIHPSPTGYGVMAGCWQVAADAYF